MDNLAVHKFTLSSGKVVYLRDPEVFDVEMAAQVAGRKAKAENTIHMQLKIQQELTRLLLVQINSEKLSPLSKEKLFGQGDKTFSLREWKELQEALHQLTGDAQGNETEQNPEISLSDIEPSGSSMLG